MNIYIKLLTILTIFILTSCTEKALPPVENAPIENPIIGIVPSFGAPANSYCNISEDGDNLEVTFTNSGTIRYGGGASVTVTFNGVSVGPKMMPAINPGALEKMLFLIPNRCFNPDCAFSVKWSNQPVVSGICIG